jgi:hypothetical protein
VLDLVKISNQILAHGAMDATLKKQKKKHWVVFRLCAWSFAYTRATVLRVTLSSAK